MEWVIVCLCAVILLICAGVVMLSADEKESSDTDIVPMRRGGVSDAREAHYMANFWNYDGAEQQDWEE